MLTRQSKEILKRLKRLAVNTDQPISYIYGSPKFCLVDDLDRTVDFSDLDDEIDSIMESLTAEGLVMADNNHVFHLSQKAIHYSQYRFKTLVKYLAEKWIDFFALAVSFAALVISLTR